MKYHSYASFNLASFYPKDYIGRKDDMAGLKKSILSKIPDLDIKKPKIFLLTQIRRLGFVFNPVSFYFICDENKRPRYVLSEIENTPWKERFSYVHAFTSLGAAAVEFDKKFHVSPFLPMDISYKWHFKIKARSITISMACERKNKTMFFANLCLLPREKSSKSLDGTVFKNLPATFLIVFFIYFQALKLWLKKVPFFDHPNPEKRKGVTA